MTAAPLFGNTFVHLVCAEDFLSAAEDVANPTPVLTLDFCQFTALESAAFSRAFENRHRLLARQPVLDGVQ
jgi:hypothetical protein